jgi:hypothetical protein
MLLARVSGRTGACIARAVAGESGAAVAPGPLSVFVGI